MYEEGALRRDHEHAVIQFHGARYTNQLLKHAKGLIGRKVLVLAHFQETAANYHALEDRARWVNCCASAVTSLPGAAKKVQGNQRKLEKRVFSRMR